MSNRLPILAQECREMQQAIIKGWVETAEKMIALGKALIEAKDLLRHGEWNQWLTDNTGISSRTASNYMRIARAGLKSETVADLGIKGVLGSLGENNGKPTKASIDPMKSKAQLEELMAAWGDASAKARQVFLVRLLSAPVG